MYVLKDRFSTLGMHLLLGRNWPNMIRPFSSKEGMNGVSACYRYRIPYFRFSGRGGKVGLGIGLFEVK